MILSGFGTTDTPGPVRKGTRMLEIEQKFAHADFSALERRLQARGARVGVDHIETDHYLNAPDRDFARTDEAFRLRQIGSTNWLTYKGPKQASPVKVRLELEVPLPDGDQAAADHLRLLTLLGYRPTAVVRKRRRHYHLEQEGFDLTVCLDEVDGLGRFAEVEVLAEEEQADRAAAVVKALALDLGLTELEPRAYLRLVLAARTEAPK
jgi:adenylate cyclase class 2